MKIQFCDECRYDGGQHFDEDGNLIGRPHHDAAKAAENALRVVEAAHEAQTKAAREIVRDAAERMYEFNANQVRAEMEAAQVDTPVIGAAFAYAAASDPETGRPWIESTGRDAQHSQQHVRHRLHVWRSLIHRSGQVAS